MSSERKIRANRANAQLGRGTKTSHGRARSAKNSLRHGLSLPVHQNPALSEEVKTLADQIAGADAGLELQEFARRIAEAQIDLRRIRYVRHQLLSDTLNDPYLESRAARRQKVAFLRWLLRPKAPDLPIDLVEKVLTTTPKGPFKFAIALSQKSKQLLTMSRYERRALSRRKFAIRAFDVARGALLKSD